MNKLKNKLKIVKDKSINKYKGLKAKIFIAMATMTCTMANASNVYAAGSNTSSIDGFIDFIGDWLVKIGGIVAMVGAVMFALGWQRDDSEQKTRGLLTMAAGFMVAAIPGARNIFGL